MRHCFSFWLNFLRRNKKLRSAWRGAAALQIEDMLR
jgi:hypothetical protein